jgi:hypothetical protein
MERRGARRTGELNHSPRLESDQVSYGRPSRPGNVAEVGRNELCSSRSSGATEQRVALAQAHQGRPSPVSSHAAAGTACAIGRRYKLRKIVSMLVTGVSFEKLCNTAPRKFRSRISIASSA